MSGPTSGETVKCRNVFGRFRSVSERVGKSRRSIGKVGIGAQNDGGLIIVYHPAPLISSAVLPTPSDVCSTYFALPDFRTIVGPFRNPFGTSSLRFSSHPTVYGDPLSYSHTPSLTITRPTGVISFLEPTVRGSCFRRQRAIARSVRHGFYSFTFAITSIVTRRALEFKFDSTDITSQQRLHTRFYHRHRHTRPRSA